MSSTKTKRYLVLLAAVGLVAAALGGTGTFASFNAETINSGNTFATGTLFLHNTKGATTCNSEDNAGNVQTSGCATLFSVPFLTDTSGDSEAHLQLTNAGTVEASGIKFKANVPCVTAANVGSGPSFANADLCLGLQVYIIETDQFYHHDATDHAYGCAYGTPSADNTTDGLGCQFASGFNLANLPAGSLASNLSPLTLKADVGGNTGTHLSAGQSRYFIIGVRPPTPLTNAYQNRKGVFDLLWHIDQA
jgi:predicted ribosomally synthesized peptide with SipW-like signal peptide